ncbi:MAG: hypothetical protein OEV59_03770 [Deltaproteobacteria bacterium]|nr:hypothetical protein [Deltaproteobacteria bacterium]
MAVAHLLHLFGRGRQRIFDEIQFREFSKLVRGTSTADAGACQEPQKTVMIDGNDHEIIWATRWSVLIQPLLRNGYRPIVLTRKTSVIQNKYYRLFGCRNFWFIDDFFDKKDLPPELLQKVDELLGSCDMKELLEFTYKGLPVGKITLSGYSRYQLRGNIDYASAAEKEGIRRLLCQNLKFAHHAQDFLEIPDVYITSEAFHDEHGIFYYYMLNKGVDVLKTNLSVIDDRVLIQRRNKANDGMHHNTVTSETFERIVNDKDIKIEAVREFVETNFAERYSDKWHLSKRNFRNTELASRQHLVEKYGLSPQKRIATIFSHILYDTLYFFEKELYTNYAEWLVDTVGVAIENKHVNWLLKLHPSNAWRGEYRDKAEYEEARIVMEAFGDLPDHVKLIYPSTPVNPLSWIRHSDFGITVRGSIGMELPCFGNNVITAASGRYAGLGFTIDPQSRQEYRDLLRNLHNIPPMTEEKIRLALYYYYAIFALKPIRLSMLKPVIRRGFKEVRLFGSLCCMPEGPIRLGAEEYPPEIESFARWAENKRSVDYVLDWEKYAD